MKCEHFRTVPIVDRRLKAFQTMNETTNCLHFNDRYEHVNDEDKQQCPSVVAIPNEASLRSEVKNNEIWSKLPMPVYVVPSTSQCPSDCARHFIEYLQAQEHFGMLSRADEDALDDGFFLCDLNVICSKLRAWKHLFPRVRPYFAIKCNPDPMIVSLIGLLGESFDCASLSEIQLAWQAIDPTRHFETDRIIYANPQRAECELEQALIWQVNLLTFDCPEELYKIHRAIGSVKSSAMKLNRPNLILRVLVDDETSVVPLGEKFGASMESVPSLTKLALKLKLPIIGVSFHCGSGNHNPFAYQRAIRLAHRAMTIVDSLQVAQGLQSCCLLDIGGGYPGIDGIGGDELRFCGNPSLLATEVHNNQNGTVAAISEVVRPLLDELFPEHRNVKLVAEPGRYFVEAAFVLCSRVYRTNDEMHQVTGELNRRHYFISQGVEGVFKDRAWCNTIFTPIPLNSKHDDDIPTVTLVVPSTIHGPSGDTRDIICEDIQLPIMNVGDWLLFDRMGAYTLSIAAQTNRPPVYYVCGVSSKLS